MTIRQPFLDVKASIFFEPGGQKARFDTYLLPMHQLVAASNGPCYLWTDARRKLV